LFSLHVCVSRNPIVVANSSLDNQGCWMHVLIVIGINLEIILYAKFFLMKVIFLSWCLKNELFTVPTRTDRTFWIWSVSHWAALRRSSTLKKYYVYSLSGKYKEIRNSCLLSVKNLNGSRHLVFWSQGTLTGLRDRVWKLVA
jgi:hypothetical protein